MDPADFLTLAIKLSNSQDEADLRTALSRAYYGAFHFVCRFLRDCGVRLSGKELYGADVHRKVRFCLNESGSPNARLAGEKLASLRQRRNEADYDLELADFRHPSYVKVEVRVAQHVLDALQRCGAEPAFPQVREKIRSYARDVLRLSVQDS